MDIWSLEERGFDPERIVSDGNRFLLANGYMGFRGTVDEWGSAQFAAVNLAGVYDRQGDKWREPVNAPNGLFVRVSVNGAPMVLGETPHLAHCLRLDYRHGLFSRRTQFPALTPESERLVSMAQPHLMASRLTLTFPEDAEVEVLAGIPRDIWDLNGPHLFEFDFSAGEALTAAARTGELHIPLAVCQEMRYDFAAQVREETGEDGAFRRLLFSVRAGETREFSLFAAVYTGLDGGEPLTRCRELCAQAARSGYDACKAAHIAAWEQIWRRCAVELEGDDRAAQAMNASLYHLNSIAPRHSSSLSIPARGLSGQTYKGAVFWDSEIFLFPVFVHTQPELARTLLRYRIETLPGALKKAAEYGYRGAFYPWESQEGGAEGCTDYNVTDVFTHRPVRTYFRDKQIHISADVAYAFQRYYEITGDRSLLREGGAEVILQCARFYLSRAHRRLDCGKVELLDVIGPDEYHERVNNSAFTNYMAASCMEAALELPQVFADEPEFLAELLERLDYAEDFALLREAAPKLKAAVPTQGLVEQFDGYFTLEDCSLDTVRGRLLDPREYWGTNRGVAAHTQIIKQADVIALMALFPQAFSSQTVAENWDYYEPRTEHGSSLSACMYALTACRIGRPDLAWEHFVKSASIDVTGGGKEWAGEIYIGGTHPAANGGAWMIAVLGFAGLELKGGQLTLSPSMPPQLKRLRFPVTAGGKRMLVTVTHDGWDMKEET